MIEGLEGVVEFLLKQGWVGILFIFMGVVVVWLARDNGRLRKELTESQNLRIQEVSEAQELRIADAKAITDTMVSTINSVHASIAVLTEIVRTRNDSRRRT